MTSAPQENTWPDYKTFVQELAKVDSNFEWLAKFFSDTPLEPAGDLNILESHDDIVEDHTCSIDDLHIPPNAGTTRIVVLFYEQRWKLDRVMVGKVAFALNLPPYFLLQHLDYGNITRPPVAASEVQSLELSWGKSGHLSAMIAPPATASTGSVRGFLSFNCVVQS
ncbi:MAG: hypothetical protein Q9181_007925 [Wetmoreana brouardii]